MKANIKSILAEIQNRQLDTFCMLEEFRYKRPLVLPRGHCGLYWIWSNLTLDDLQNMPTSRKTEVPISELVRQQRGSTKICKIKLKKFTIVYNGIGGKKPSAKSGGLRERILQEFKARHELTGSLNLWYREGFDIKNWAISYFDFNDRANEKIIKHLTYSDHAGILETNWRIEFGMPILTRR